MRVVTGRAAILLAACTAMATTSEASKPRLIIDADTGNEIDDLFAIVRMLNQDRFEVVGLTSAQWRHYLGPVNSVAVSQQDNEDLLELLGRENLPHPIGSEQPFGKPWGGTQPQDSPAARFIIEQAKATPAGRKLIVVCTGASTNLASAIKLAPEIAPRIKAYIIGFHCDPESGVWNKSEFNVRRDLDAADFLLNQADLELCVMPANVSKAVVFARDETFARQEQMGPLGAHLTAKWLRKFPEHETWIMWDLALVEALLSPDLATTRRVSTPPENTQREVLVYDSIDASAMMEKYWAVVADGYTSKP